MRVFHKNFLRKEEIEIIPSSGYRNADRHSRKALKWLVWKERELGHRIIHRMRIRNWWQARWRILRVGVGKCNVTCFSFTGVSGILRLSDYYQMNRDRTLSSADRNDTIDAHYKWTLVISSTYHLQKRGYHVIEKWKCDFDREMRENPEMNDFLKKESYINKIRSSRSSRCVFRWSYKKHTIAIRYEIAGAEKICYVNTCSLYPYMLKTSAFPYQSSRYLYRRM